MKAISKYVEWEVEEIDPVLLHIFPKGKYMARDERYTVVFIPSTNGQSMLYTIEDETYIAMFTNRIEELEAKGNVQIPLF